MNITIHADTPNGAFKAAVHLDTGQALVEYRLSDGQRNRWVSVEGADIGKAYSKLVDLLHGEIHAIDVLCTRINAMTQAVDR